MDDIRFTIGDKYGKNPAAFRKRIFIKEYNPKWANEFIKIKTSSRQYSCYFRMFHSYLKNKSIKNPTSKDTQEYYNNCSLGYSDNTLYVHILVLKMYFKWLAKKGLYKNICSKLKEKKFKRMVARKPLSNENFELALSSIDLNKETGKRDYLVLYLLYNLGIRANELLKLKIGDIKPENLKDYKASLCFNEIMQESNNNYDTYLFVSFSDRNRGGHLTTTTISMIVRAALRAINIDLDKITADSLRYRAKIIREINERKALLE